MKVNLDTVASNGETVTVMDTDAVLEVLKLVRARLHVCTIAS